MTTIRPVSGCTANWMLQPPVSTPTSRSTAMARSRMRLVLAVGQRHRRRDRDRVAGVHAHRVDVLDRADDDDVVVAVAHQLELELLPAEHALLDQHLVHRARGQPGGGHPAQPLRVAGHPGAGAAHRERRPQHHRQAELVGGRQHLVQRRGRPPLRGTSPPTARTISLNRSRSSPRRIASTSAPISRTPYRSSTPVSASSTAMFSAVWPPRVASTASGRSRAITLVDELRRSAARRRWRRRTPGRS